MNAHELHKMIDARRKLKVAAFDDILQRCLRSMKRHVEINPGSTAFLFTVPYYDFGKAIYDFDECKLHIWKRLRELGYKVRAHSAETLRVSWARGASPQGAQRESRVSNNERTHKWVESIRAPLVEPPRPPPAASRAAATATSVNALTPSTRGPQFPSAPVPGRLDLSHVHPYAGVRKTSNDFSGNRQFNPSVTVTRIDRKNASGLQLSFD